MRSTAMLGTSLAPVPSLRVARTLWMATLAATVATASLALIGARTHDPCAPDVPLAALSPRARDLIARRVMACSDRARGDLTAAEYRARIAVLDAAWDATPPAAPPATRWAASVRGVSSEYTNTSWSAARALGPPDVYPGSGDNANAWASLTADGGPEWIEVGYAQPVPISAVQIVETFNPGAIARVELITTSGERLAYPAAPEPQGTASHLQQIDVPCTQAPIAAVRVELASQAVPGWNEIDAIGVVPCAAP